MSGGWNPGARWPNPNGTASPSVTPLRSSDNNLPPNSVHSPLLYIFPFVVHFTNPQNDAQNFSPTIVIPPANKPPESITNKTKRIPYQNCQKNILKYYYVTYHPTIYQNTNISFVLRVSLPETAVSATSFTKTHLNTYTIIYIKCIGIITNRSLGLLWYLEYTIGLP